MKSGCGGRSEEGTPPKEEEEELPREEEKGPPPRGVGGAASVKAKPPQCGRACEAPWTLPFRKTVSSVYCEPGSDLGARDTERLR